MDSKVCSKCKVEKPSFLFSESENRPCGRYSSCNECEKSKQRNSRDKANARAKKWRDLHPEKLKEVRANYEGKNPMRNKLRIQEKRTSPEFVIAERERARQRYATNPQAHIEKVKAWKSENPEKAKRLRQEYWDKNPGARNAARMKRHAAKLQATPKWADSKQIVKVYQEAKLKSIETGESWHVDHVIPLQSELVCGLHVEFNLAVLPKRDNLRKSNRLIT